MDTTMTHEVIEDCQNVATRYKKIAQSIGPGGVRLATAGEYEEAALAINMLCRRLSRMHRRWTDANAAHLENLERLTVQEIERQTEGGPTL